MKIYSDGFCLRSNPSPWGGGYSIVDEYSNLIGFEEIIKEGLTSNEAELLGVVRALELSNKGDTVITDSSVVISWINKPNKGSRKDLRYLKNKAANLIKIKSVNLLWGPREDNLAGIYNEVNNAECY